MIIAGVRPPEYAAAMQAERARRAAEVDPVESDRSRDKDVDGAEEPVRSAVDIAPRPPSD